MVYRETRHKIYIALLIFLIFICFISQNGTYQMWLVPTITIGVFYLTDIMFLTGKQFEYDPDYDNWKRKNEPTY